jgi:hypothetical protein
MLTLCVETNKTFSEYEDTSVVWSGDKLPVCPHCRQTPYEGDKFSEKHRIVEEPNQ